jgi:hypothetical protein
LVGQVRQAAVLDREVLEGLEVVQDMDPATREAFFRQVFARVTG